MLDPGLIWKIAAGVCFALVLVVYVWTVCRKP